jgi:hypothetical protein
VYPSIHLTARLVGQVERQEEGVVRVDRDETLEKGSHDCRGEIMAQSMGPGELTGELTELLLLRSIARKQLYVQLKILEDSVKGLLLYTKEVAQLGPTLVVRIDSRERVSGFQNSDRCRSAIQMFRVDCART